jgi:hypothetical protein
VRGQAHRWYRPALARESGRRERQQHRRTGGETAFQAAFKNALQIWALHHVDDVGTQIVIPTGAVQATELRRVVIALISIKRREGETR